MTGPHWTRFNKRGLCEGRSPLLIAHQLTALPFFESKWRQDPRRYGDACGFLRKLAAEHSLDLFNGGSCVINTSHSNLYLWIARIPQSCRGRMTSTECWNYRGVSNGPQLAAELSQRYPQQPGGAPKLLLTPCRVCFEIFSVMFPRPDISKADHPLRELWAAALPGPGVPDPRGRHGHRGPRGRLLERRPLAQRGPEAAVFGDHAGAGAL